MYDTLLMLDFLCVQFIRKYSLFEREFLYINSRRQVRHFCIPYRHCLVIKILCKQETCLCVTMCECE